MYYIKYLYYFKEVGRSLFTWTVFTDRCVIRLRLPTIESLMFHLPWVLMYSGYAQGQNLRMVTQKHAESVMNLHQNEFTESTVNFCLQITKTQRRFPSFLVLSGAGRSMMTDIDRTTLHLNNQRPVNSLLCSIWQVLE